MMSAFTKKRLVASTMRAATRLLGNGDFLNLGRLLCNGLHTALLVRGKRLQPWCRRRGGLHGFRQAMTSRRRKNQVSGGEAQQNTVQRIVDTSWIYPVIIVIKLELQARHTNNTWCAYDMQIRHLRHPNCLNFTCAVTNKFVNTSLRFL